jgi:endonuclease YncB( thermonuclease family)
VPVVVLLGVVGIVEDFKLSPASLLHLLNSANEPPSIINSEVGAQTITGRASVIDGDTIEIHGTRIRLFGIDAPESDQLCTILGKPFRCGQQAAFALADEIGNKVVNCRPKDRDRYGRVVAVCLVGGEDINAWMVAKGWAIAYRHYSNDYVRQEEQASKSKIGIWQGEFVSPSDWRRGDHLQQKTNSQPSENNLSNATTSNNCVIKGNISHGKRIYHVPGGEFYSRTIIDVAKGERWFCNEAEAQAAGWRPSRR